MRGRVQNVKIGHQQVQTEGPTYRVEGQLVKWRARNGVGESNGGHVHITVSMALTVFVGFGVEG